MRNVVPSGCCLNNGKYRIEKVLGQGGFGITYLAYKSDSESPVAIKEFFVKEYCYRDSSSNIVSLYANGNKELIQNFKNKFMKECRLLSSFRHPNIVEIYDVFEDNDTAYYVMKYLPYGTLDNMISAQGCLSENIALKLIREAAQALDYIHRLNVLHLDIKPANILLDEGGHVVLIDFGISKHYDETGSQTSTSPGAISKGYAPLEQYNSGVKDFTPSTDIYSLGATLFKMLTGKTPPEASALLNDGFPYHALENKGISGSLISCISKSMNPIKSHRYQNIKDFILALECPDSADDEVTVTVDTDDDGEADFQKIVEHLQSNKRYKDAYDMCLDKMRGGQYFTYSKRKCEELIPYLKMQTKKENRKQIFVVAVFIVVVSVLSAVIAISI